MGFFGRSSEEPEPQRDAALDELHASAGKTALPPAVKQVVDRELALLGRISPSASEYSIGIAYLNYVLSLPWNTRTEDNLDIRRAEEILDRNHYGLRRIKERVLEYLAVRKLQLGRRNRVLVVDDEDIARKNIAHVLLKDNYTVETADGIEAAGKLGATEYDIILTDLKMPKIDGMEILRLAKARQPRTEVIMITGYATIDTAVEAMKKGAFHYIAKPFNLDDMRAVVAQAATKQELRREAAGPVLCFAGPPGTGKTSLGRSVAQALGRKFARISLGGIRDEAEIRGHRRTYAGAMPGRIIEEIRRIETKNPVIILDEVDKLAHDLKGDPAAALLEALDPEQNRSFTDHYLDMPFDLSQVLFIITANVPDHIIAPLRDRMEVIEFTGYTEEEKVRIALDFLVRRQVTETGLADHPPSFNEDAIYRIIRDYTYEAGIRGLNREIGQVCRKIARDVVDGGGRPKPVAVIADTVPAFLGPRKYHLGTAAGTDRIGITTGLVWTEVGGDIITVEAVTMKGRQKLILTGSLGSVMQESAQAALSYVRSNAATLGIPEDFFDAHDVHIHVPAGAIPKDGPSAGATIAIALISLLTRLPARWDVAVTGELTLSGRLLPVGGVKEKLLAARRARILTVILPRDNRVDVENLSENSKDGLTIVFAGHIAEAIDTALGKQG